MKKCPNCSTAYDDFVESCSKDGTPLVELVNEVDPLVGQLLAGRFLITEKIAQGGMGAVYKANQVKIDRVCAVKLLNPAATGVREAESRFNREAHLASRIDSPHAVTIYDFGETEGGAFFLAMEYVDGVSLSKVLERNRTLPVERVVRIVRQITEALAAAHALGIVHRDLKPDNVMLTQKGSEIDYVKVLDFGIAKPVAEDAREKLTQTGFVLGTPVYMSPEHLSGEEVDPTSDVYSLALITYEMLSGRLPFEGDNAQAIMIKRVTTDPIPLRAVAPSLSPAVERAIMAGLARDQGVRTPTVERFAAELEAACISSRPTESVRGGLGRETAADRRGSLETLADGDLDALGVDASGESERGFGGLERPEIDSLLPPSAYVTRASSSVEGADNVLPRAAPTVRIEQSRASAPASESTSPQTSNSSTSRYRRELGAGTSRRSAKRLIIAAVVALGVIAGGGTAGYYWLFHQPSATSQPEVEESSGRGTEETSDGNARAAQQEDLAQVAERHYQTGLKHQEEALRFQQAERKAQAMEEHNKAIEEYRRAVIARPHYPEAHENWGVSLSHTDRLESAIEQYEVAINQYAESGQPPPGHVYANYGLALFGVKRYRDAAEAFGRAADRDPSDYDLLAYRGYALQNGGDTTAAYADYRRYLQLAPSGREAARVRSIMAGRESPPTPGRDE